MLPKAWDSTRAFAKRPSSTLGWVAVVTGSASIVLLVFINVMAEQGSGIPRWQALAGFLSLVVASAIGLIAVLRRHERSWIVVVPTTLAVLVVANELIQGVLALFGLGGE